MRIRGLIVAIFPSTLYRLKFDVPHSVNLNRSFTSNNDTISAPTKSRLNIGNASMSLFY